MVEIQVTKMCGICCDSKPEVFVILIYMYLVYTGVMLIALQPLSWLGE